MRTITREHPRGRVAGSLALLACLALAAGCDTTAGGGGKKADAAPGRDATAPGRDATAPGKDATSPAGDAATPARDTGGPGTDSAPTRKDGAPRKDAAPATCGPAKPGEVGAPCTSAGDCKKTPGSPFCQSGFWKGGYCLDGSKGFADNCDRKKPLASCPAPCTVCTVIPFFGKARCVRRCKSNADCRAGYACKDTNPKSGYKWCSPPF